MLKDGTTVSRVSMCEACQRAPAAFLCKADAASLCSSCDNEIHSANPLAFKHHRVPILPIDHGFIGNNGYNEVEKECVDEENVDEDEAALWLLLNPVKNYDIESNWFLFEEDHDNQQHDYNGVLQKSFAVDKDISVEMQQHHAQYFQPGLEFDSSKAAFSYNGSISQSVSISSIDVGIVPESTASDASIFSHSEIPIGTTIDQFSGPIQMTSYLAPLDREARVLRYREKKKTRKFEKKIRYASRKAYAETRPRIKGRFVKETDAEAEVDQVFSTQMSNAGYGVVPSF